MNNVVDTINGITRNRSIYEEKTVRFTSDEFHQLIHQNGWKRSSDVRILSFIEETGQVSGIGTVKSSHGAISVFYTESFQYTLGDEESFKTSIDGLNSPWMATRAKGFENIGDEEEIPAGWGKFPAIFSKVDYVSTKDKIRNVVIEVETFNEDHQPTKAKVFLRELKRPGANTRSPHVSVGNSYCFFVFTGKVALICIESDEIDLYFAFDAEKAEACLDETIQSYKDTGQPYDDWRQNRAYLAAARTLRDKVYPPKIPFNAYCAEDDRGY